MAQTQGTYTAVNLPQDGETIDASDVNTDLGGLIDEFNKQVGTTKLADASITQAKFVTETSTTFVPATTGFVTENVQFAKYFKYGRLVFIDIDVSGTSNSASNPTFTLPFPAARAQQYAQGRAVDNGTSQIAPCCIRTAAGSDMVDVLKDAAGSSWSGAGLKEFNIAFTYEANI